MRRPIILFAFTSLFHLSTSASILCGATNETPFHNNIPPMTTSSPYSILTSVSIAHQNETVTLLIKSVLSELKFEGFIVHAFSTDRPGEVLGRFISPAEGLKLSNCNGEDNVATYRTYPGESEIELQWKAPSDYVGEILFNATIAQNYDTFWTGIASIPLQVVRSEAASLKSYFMSSPSVPSNEIRNELEFKPLNSDLIYEGCGTTKTCFGLPINCIELQSCRAVVTAYSINNRFEFELTSNVSGVAHVAVGLSADHLMGEDSVMECINQNGNVSLFTSYNNSREGVPQAIVTLVNWSLDNGNIYCKFERQAVSTVLDIEFDLTKENFHFLLAIGSDLANETLLTRHNLGHLASPEPLQIIERRHDDAIYEGCGSTKTCVGLPIDCLPLQSCDAVATATNVDNRFLFELQSTAPGAGYVAFGLSRDPGMGDTSVVECVQQGGIIQQYNSWNLRRSNSRIEVPQDITSLIDFSFNDGTIYCKLERDEFSIIQGSEFNLRTEQFYFQIAVGRHFTPESVSIHDLGRMSSAEPLRIITPGTDPIYEGCGTDKTCFGMPPRCVEELSCQAIVAVTVEDDQYEFEIQSDVVNAGYVSFALSRDILMGDDSSIDCVRENNNNIRAHTSWNTGRPNLGNTRDGVSQDIIDLLYSTYIDGKIYCKVRRDKSTVVQEKNFNLAEEDFYFLLAIGRSATANVINMHDLGFASSTEAIPLPGSSARAPYVVRLSAVSIVAWLLLTSCAHIFRGS